MKVKFTKEFEKQLGRAPEKIRKIFGLKLGIFVLDKFSPLLKNHGLSGNLRGFRSINITGDWQAIFEEISEKDIVMFRSIGTHSQLYK
ncbi:MAG: type II toxin-antitoxin system RelE/ParE family toxin [Candidatus Moraniibacteriota bacterium]